MAEVVELSVADRIELVKAAIERIKDAQERYRKVQSDASSSPFILNASRKWVKSAEDEFAWQWKNVEMIFKEKGI